MSENNETVTVASLLNGLKQNKNLESINIFPPLINSEKEKEEKENLIQEQEKKLNELSTKDVFDLIKKLNIFDRLTKDEIDDNTIEYYLKGINSPSDTFRVNINENNETAISHIHERGDEESPYAFIYKNSDLIKYLFELKYSFSSDNEYSLFLNNNFSVNQELENKIENNNQKNNINYTLEQDSIFKFLNYHATENEYRFYLQDIGFFQQIDKEWILVGYENKKIQLNDIDKLFKMIVSIKSNNNINYDDTLEKDFNLLKKKYENFLNEVEDKKNKIKTENIDVDSTFDIDDIVKKINENEKTVENNLQTTIHDYPIYDDYYDGENDEVFFDENGNILYTRQNYQIDSYNYDSFDEKQLEEQIKINEQMMESLMEISQMTHHEENIDYMDNIYFGKDYDDVMSFIHQEKPIENIGELEHQGYNIQNNQDTLWDKIDDLKLPIEDVLNHKYVGNLLINPYKIEYWSDDKRLYLKTPKYIFKDKTDNKYISFVVKDNIWIMNEDKDGEMNKPIIGKDVSNFIKMIYKSFDLPIMEENAQPYLDVLTANKKEIENNKMTRNLYNEFIKNIYNKYKNEEDIQPLEYILNTYINPKSENKENNFLRILNISLVKNVERKGISNDEYIIEGKTYRFKNNDWYCIEDKEKSNGIANLLKHIYHDNENLINKYLESYRSFIKNYVLKNEFSFNQDHYKFENKSIDKNINSENENHEYLIDEGNYDKEFIENSNISDVKTNEEYPLEYEYLSEPINNNEYDSYLSEDQMVHDINQNIDNINFDDNDEIHDNLYHTENNSSNLTHNKENNYEEQLNKDNKEDINPSDEYQKLAKNQLNEEIIIEDFEELVKIKLNKMLSKRSLIDNFKINTFLDICSENKTPYHVRKINEHEYLFGKEGKTQFTINSQNYENVSSFVNFVCSKYPTLDLNSEKDRLTKILEPILVSKIRNQIQLNMEEKKTQLIEKDIDKQQKLIDTTTKYNENSKVEEKNDDFPIKNDENKDINPLNDYNISIGLDSKSLHSQLKKFLYEYNNEINNQFIKIELDNLIKNLAFTFNREDLKTDIQYQKEYSNNHYIYNITIDNKIKIKAYSGLNDESYKIVQNDENNPHFSKDGESLMELIKNIFSYKNIRLNNIDFHQAIANVKEMNLLSNFPMQEIMQKIGADKKGTNYFYQNLTIGIKSLDGNGEMFSIWDRGVSGQKSSIKLMQYILAQQHNLDVNSETISNSQYKDICGFAKAKESLKNLYLGLNSLEKLSLYKQNNTKGEYFNSNDFNILLPDKSNDSSIMHDYLINNRKINPAFVNELDGRYIYQGEYDRNHVQIENHKYNLNKPIEWATVIVFANDKSGSIRGCQVGISDDIKMNIPGSSSEDNLYSIPPCKDYYYPNEENKINKKVVVEAGVDALSYRCFYPKAEIFVLNGTNVNPIESALIEAKEILKENANIQIVYALDNTNIQDNGTPLDNGSYNAYQRLNKKMKNHCYETFMKDNADFFENEYYDIELINNTFECLKTNYKFSESQLEWAYETLHKILENSNEEISIQSKNYKDELGKIMFKLEYFDTGLFKIESPQHPKYGIYKDWNDFLKNVVEIKMKENPNLSLQEIHNNIIDEFSPELKHISLKPKKQQSLSM